MMHAGTVVVVVSFFCHSIILEADPNIIAQRVAMKGADSDFPLSEQTISQVK